MALTQPNIIVIVSDDEEMGTVDADAMSYLSSDPHGHWVKFPNGGCSSPRCNTYRGALFHGQRGDRNGVTQNDDKPTWDQDIQVGYWLSEAGYDVGLAGKYLNQYPWVDYPGAIGGFTFWRGTGELSGYNNWTARDEAGVTIDSDTYGGPTYFTDACRDWAIEFLEGTTATPFCLFVTPYAPHGPYTPATRHVGLNAGGTTDPTEFNQLPANAPAWHSSNFPSLSSGNQTSARTDRKQSRRAMMAVDECIEAIFDTLVTIDKLDDTVVFFATDNGYGHGRHRVWENGANQKRMPYKWCIQPGMMRVRHPEATSRVAPEACTQLDITASLAHWAGLDRTDVQSLSGHDLDGMPLEPIILDTAETWRDVQEFYHEAVSPVPTWWVAHNWHTDLAYHDYPTVPGSALYDRNSDPAELDNVVGDAGYADEVTDLDTILAALQSDPHARDDQPRSAGGGGGGTPSRRGRRSSSNGMVAL